MFVVGPLSWLFAGDDAPAPPPPPPPPPPAPGVPIRKRVPTIVWLNDTPAEQLGLTLLAPRGDLAHLSIPPAPVTMFPGLTGGRYELLQPVAPRLIELEGHHVGTDFGVRRRWLDALQLVLRGLVEVRWADDPTRVARGRVSVLFAEGASGLPYVDPTLRVRVTITCADTALYDRDAQVLPLSTTPIAVPLGTLPSGGEIGLTGPFTGDAALELLAPTGVPLERLQLRSVTLEAGDACTIRMDPPHAIARIRPDGTVLDATGWRDVAGSTRWWQVAPLHGALAPRLVLVPGEGSTGTLSGWYRYRRAWA